MKRTRAVWAMGAVLAIAPAVSAQSSPAGGATPVTVRVRVADYANVAPKLRVEAGKVAAEIYRAAGIETFWWDTPLDPSNTLPAGRARDLMVILVSDAQTEKIHQTGLDDATMGATFSNGDDRPVVGYVFYDRIERMAVQGRNSVSRLLGEVMAHEVGHMLLPRGHSATGIMRAQRPSRFGLLQEFTKDQGALMRRRLEATEGATPASQPPTPASTGTVNEPNGRCVQLPVARGFPAARRS